MKYVAMMIMALLVAALPTYAASNTKHMLQWFPTAKTQKDGADITWATDKDGAATAIPYNGCSIKIDDVFTMVVSQSPVSFVSVSLVQQNAAIAAQNNAPDYADWTVNPVPQVQSPPYWRGWWTGSWVFTPTDFTTDGGTPLIWPGNGLPDRLGVTVNVQLTQNVTATGFIRVIYEYVNCQ